MKKIAVIGSGISGHVATYYLKKDFDITLYEADNRFGGHANTVDIQGNNPISIDTGFIVYNELTYPGLTRLFDELDVKTVETDMSFGVQDECSGLQYSTHNFNQLFAQRKNLYSIKFFRIWWDFLRFRPYANYFLIHHQDDLSTTVGDLVRESKCSIDFKKYFLYPMAGAIWSTSPEEIEEYPARSFLEFMFNHRMLDIFGQPSWRTVKGGSKLYVERIIASGGYRMFKNSPVRRIIRLSEGVKVVADNQEDQLYDEVIIATHSDQALKMISDPTDLEIEVLKGIRFQKNIAILHQDHSLMPPNKRAWAAWNVYLHKEKKGKVELTYDMNLLQHIKGDPWYVTLNPYREVNEEKVYRKIEYDHPFFDIKALKAQEKWSSVSGVNRLHFCGAYWKWGFHEDGLWSALRVVNAIQKIKANRLQYA